MQPEKTMKRRHSMPFGAEVLAHGVHFRLWAPAARRVTLCLARTHREDIFPMLAQAGGWFELVVPGAGAGMRYGFRLDDNQLMMPDPASRCNPDDVHQASQVIDPTAFDWNDGNWRGRWWEEAVIYELHVGCFTQQGTFAALRQRLDYLVDLGVTAIELMPVADFPGACNWGYDGVLPFAPDGSYGPPEELKFFIDAAHSKGIMVLLDVVYNHFGPEGNYLPRIAPPFFSDLSEHRRTPWGNALNFDGPNSRTVRDFFIHNTLYWLEEFNIDGLRLDAVHAIIDDSIPDFLTELVQAVHAGPGRDRHIHLILENDHNAAHYLRRDVSGHPIFYTSQWNDDIHHALHVLLSGERDGYYVDYADNPIAHLGRCLAEGFSYQGQISPFRAGKPRGESSGNLPAGAFVNFLQNHDQVGNRAHGERISMLANPCALRAAIAILLLAPSPPLLFMGEEFSAAQPFQFFCDFELDLAAAVTRGRRSEFSRFEQFGTSEAQGSIPDPCDPETFARCKLDWSTLAEPLHDDWLTFYRSLLALRHALIMPLLATHQFDKAGANNKFQMVTSRGLIVHWRLESGGELILSANLGDAPLAGFTRPSGDLFYTSEDVVSTALAEQFLPPWSVAWILDRSMEEAAHV